MFGDFKLLPRREFSGKADTFDSWKRLQEIVMKALI